MQPNNPLAFQSSIQSMLGVSTGLLRFYAARRYLYIDNHETHNNHRFYDVKCQFVQIPAPLASLWARKGYENRTTLSGTLAHVENEFDQLFFKLYFDNSAILK